MTATTTVAWDAGKGTAERSRFLAALEEDMGKGRSDTSKASGVNAHYFSSLSRRSNFSTHFSSDCCNFSGGRLH